MADIIYKINNKSLMRFEDNYQYLGDLVFAVYLILKRPLEAIFFRIIKSKVLSYCIIIAFHPKLDIERKVIYRSFQQNQNQLFDLSHY